MNIEIKNKKENKLLGRQEVEGKVTYEQVTPSNEALKEKLAVELKGDKELIVVKHIYPRYSYREANFLAYIYENKEGKERMEVKMPHLKKKEKGEKKAAEKPNK